MARPRDEKTCLRCLKNNKELIAEWAKERVSYLMVLAIKSLRVFIHGWYNKGY